MFSPGYFNQIYNENIEKFIGKFDANLFSHSFIEALIYHATKCWFSYDGNFIAVSEAATKNPG